MCTRPAALLLAVAVILAGLVAARCTRASFRRSTAALAVALKADCYSRMDFTQSPQANSVHLDHAAR